MQKLQTETVVDAPLPRVPRPFVTRSGDGAPSRSDVRAVSAQILGLTHRLRRAALKSQRGNVIAAKATIVAPARAAREAWDAVCKYGDVTAEDAGISRMRQFAWMWWLSLRYNYSDHEVYRFRLFSRDRVLPTPLFLPWEAAALLYRTVILRTDRKAADILADKRRFAAWCEEQQLPTAPILMEFEGGQITRRGIAEGESPPVDLFAKWGTKYGGDATERWLYDEALGYVDDNGRAWTFQEVTDSLAERSREGVVLLQPRLVNHPALRPLSPRALSTIRVMTTQRPHEAPRFLAAVLRMGTGKATADNFAQGGIASPIDAETGVIGDALGIDKQHRTHVYHSHPDTDVEFAGYEVPFWKESVQLALDAHARLGQIACVGWDVAVLEDGPALIEGNWNPCTKLLQVATQVPLLTTEFAATYAAWLTEPECAVDDGWLVEQKDWQPV
jgi:putative polysaccharide biosynthesis protein